MKNKKNIKEKNNKQIVSEEAFLEVMAKIEMNIKKFLLISRIILCEQMKSLYKNIDMYIFLLKENKEIANKLLMKSFIEYNDCLYKEILNELNNYKDSLVVWWPSQKKSVSIFKKFLKSLDLIKREGVKKRKLYVFINELRTNLVFSLLIQSYHLPYEEAEIALAIIIAMWNDIVNTSDIMIFMHYLTNHKEKQFREILLENINDMMDIEDI